MQIQPKVCSYGAPQRSGVSQELFLIYINDIAKCLACAKCVLYADDTNIFVESKTISDLYVIRNQENKHFT